MITKEMLAKQLGELHIEGQTLVAAFDEEEKKGKQEAEPFEVGYQRWYTKALPLMVSSTAANAHAGQHGPCRPAKQDAQPGRWRSHPVSWCTQGAHP